jgi:hypothetical protein
MKLDLNRLVIGIHGNMDRIIYKQFENGTITVPKPPVVNRPPTPAQVRVRNRFTEAASYATAVLADPARSAPYLAVAKEQKRQSSRPVIMADYLNPPVVHELDLALYFGRIGDPIKIRASDDFGVVAVKVRIKNGAGVVLEEGLAQKGDVRWVYLGQTVVPNDQDLLIEAEAADRAGNERVLSEPWHA